MPPLTEPNKRTREDISAHILMVKILRLVFTALLLLSLQVSQVHAQASDTSTCSDNCGIEDTIRNTTAEFVQAINNEDAEAVTRLIDMRNIGKQISLAMFDSESQQTSFYDTFIVKGPESAADAILRNLRGKDSPTWFIRLLREDERLQALLRIDLEDGGYEYMILSMRDDGMAIVDIYFASAGALFSEQIEDATKLLVKPSAFIVSRLLGHVDTNEDLVTKFKSVASLRTQQKYQEAYDIIKSMPEEIQHNKTILLSTIQLAQFISNDLYFSELKTLATHHGDDQNLQFLLVDYYSLSENYEAAIKAISAAQDRFGNDGALYDLKANLYYSNNNIDKAIENAKLAIDIEYDFEAPYWTLIAIYIEQENYALATKLFAELANNFGYEFARENFAADEFYAKFAKSKIFDKWITTQQTADRSKSNFNH